MALKTTQPQYIYGFPTPIGALFPKPHLDANDPTVFDFGTVGQEWVNTATNSIFFLASVANGVATWVKMETAGGAGVFSSLTVTPGPISLTGTTTINTAGTAATTIGNATSTSTLTGTVHINTAGAGVTTIGVGGTGAVNIGNATGNTAVTGQLVVSTNFFTTNGSVSAGNTDAAATSSNLQILKSRGGGVITTGDTLGNILFAGFDGTGYTNGASITSTSSGTIAATRVAGDLKFNTHPDSAGVTATRMTIAPAGNITIATPDSGTALSISAATTAISVTAGDITIGAGDLNINTPGQGINLPGPVQIITGAGAPANPLALHVGDVYINTTGSGVNDRMWIATGVGAWTFFVTGA